ncbi:DUF697 domain-containing protein [Zavarzinella formosa]|uniref:DUF697 domain-containing protein n=1 Tax=Zavarzinella formosa TaxID=360055 RepID=UPI0002E87E92|nr:DUF697 domain-containing protein [Zavarzinella formosa]
MNDLDDMPLMLPQAPRRPEPPVPVPLPDIAQQRLSSENFESRPGETDEGEGRLAQVPPTLTTPAKNDLPRELTLLDAEMQQAQELLASEPTVFGLPSLFGHPLVGLVMLGMGGILGLFLFNQVSTAIIAIQALSGPMWYAAWGVFGLLSFLVLYSVSRLIVLYLKLRRNKQLRLRGLEELERRTRLRWLINAKRHEAYEQLTNYLLEYPASTDRDRKRLARVGLAGDSLYAVMKTRDQLMDKDRWPDSQSWFVAFRETFQQKLDDAARERIKYWSRRAAFATAVSPNALADTGMTLYFSFAMIADLCTIYNLRAGRLGTMVLLTRVFFNSYAAGQINEMEGMASDQLQQFVEPHLPASEVFLGKVFGKLGAKASAGAVNYLLISRLGKYAAKVLRPVSHV